MMHSSLLTARDVARVVNPQFESGRVDGHRARRLIDGRDVMATDPFILMAEDFMPRDAFSQHPHRGIETVTLVLDGALEHFDSAGHSGLIEKGDAQWMTAGRGVIHNENALAGSIAHTLQLWVNLPASSKMTAPRYQSLHGTGLPVRRAPGVEVRLLSGGSGDVVSPTLNHVQVTALDAQIDAGASFDQALEPDVNVFVLVLEGEARIGASAMSVVAGELAWLNSDESTVGSAVTLAADALATRVLLFAGHPLREPVAFGGPFVMNTPAEIEQAYADYQNGRF